MRNLASWFKRRREPLTPPELTDEVQLPRPGASAPVKHAGTVTVAGARLVFDLDWRPVDDPDALNENLSHARRSGFNHVAVMPGRQLIGLARAIQPGSGKPHSAVVLLVERFSAGGAEACLLSFGGRVAFVGLMDRLPVPGYDRLLPDMDTALSLLQEFKEIHVDHEIRVASNLPAAVPDSETLHLDDLFSRPEGASALRLLFNKRLVRAVLSSVAVVGTIAGVGGWYLWDQQRQSEERAAAERAAAERDPNRIYESQIDDLLRQLGAPGDRLLDQWRQTIVRLPLSREGWTLQRIDCTRSARACIANWRRNYGTFAQFQRGIETLGTATTARADQTDGDMLNVGMSTVHAIDEGPVTSAAAADRLVRQALPELRASTEDWGSRLQDLSLVIHSSGADGLFLKPATVFGPASSADAIAIRRPVLSMAWRITDDIWSLPSISLPANAIADSLVVQLSPSGITYSLNGSVYVKGKHF